jgi:hypothetical protein
MDEAADDLAVALHDLFCERLRAQALQPNAGAELHAHVHSQLRPFATLPRSEQDEYRIRVRQFLAALGESGYRLAREASGETSPELDIEALAASEHHRWLIDRVAQGWRWAPRTDRGQRLHSALLDWRELPESKKALVRELFRDLPLALHRAGWHAERDARAVVPGAGAHPRVFISARSSDYRAAGQVYRFLTAAGVPAFFSQESLPALGVSDYRKQIDEALDRVEHMVVVASSGENVRASWVEAEWGFFINEKRSGRKTGNLVTVVVGGLAPAALPPSLRQYEVIPIESLQTLLRYVAAASSP